MSFRLSFRVVPVVRQGELRRLPDLLNPAAGASVDGSGELLRQAAGAEAYGYGRTGAVGDDYGAAVLGDAGGYEKSPRDVG